LQTADDFAEGSIGRDNDVGEGTGFDTFSLGAWVGFVPDLRDGTLKSLSD
jgi:hypothetical protein